MMSQDNKNQLFPSVLLLQFRSDPIIRKNEYDSFVRYLGLNSNQLTSFDVLTKPLNLSLLDGVDALVIAGNGSESSNDDLYYKTDLMALLRSAYDRGLPTLAVCYGAQFSALEFGGDVQRVKEMSEVGTYPIHLTEAAAEDVIFKELDTTFNGQMGHNDSITRLPDGAVRLAYSDRVPNQAFRFLGKPYYAVQFHPELDADEMRARLHYYKDHYAHSPEEYQGMLDRIQSSTDASALLK